MTQRLTILLALLGSLLLLVQCHPPVPTPVAPANGDRPAAGVDPRDGGS